MSGDDARLPGADPSAVVGSADNIADNSDNTDGDPKQVKKEGLVLYIWGDNFLVQWRDFTRGKLEVESPQPGVVFSATGF